MTPQPSVRYHNVGFTLIETIIYIGLFGIMITGIFVSMYPLFTNAQRLTANILIDGESAFILTKIKYALAHTITSTQGVIISPKEGETANVLTITNGTQQYEFAEDTSQVFCTPPLICSPLTLSQNGQQPQALNSERVAIENFTVTHTAPVHNGALRRLEVSFTANGVAIPPMVFELQF